MLWDGEGLRRIEVLGRRRLWDGGGFGTVEVSGRRRLGAASGIVEMMMVNVSLSWSRKVIWRRRVADGDNVPSPKINPGALRYIYNKK